MGEAAERVEWAPEPSSELQEAVEDLLDHVAHELAAEYVRLMRVAAERKADASDTKDSTD